MKLAWVQSIVLAVENTKRLIQHEHSRHQQSLQVLNEELETIRSLCPHPVVVTLFEPVSGAGASECQVCGRRETF